MLLTLLELVSRLKQRRLEAHICEVLVGAAGDLRAVSLGVARLVRGTAIVVAGFFDNAHWD